MDHMSIGKRCASLSLSPSPHSPVGASASTCAPLRAICSTRFQILLQHYSVKDATPPHRRYAATPFLLLLLLHMCALYVCIYI